MTRKGPTGAARRLLGGTLVLAGILWAGTFGYWLLTGRQHSLLDCLYMTFITITTIGFGEIIDLSHLPAGRVFTMLVGLSGIVTATFIFTSLTAFIVEGELTESFRRTAMEKKVRNLRGHYIVCGIGAVGLEILQELLATRRPCVAVDPNAEQLRRLGERFPEALYLLGDATDNDTLLAAGIVHAEGLFAATHDDNLNLAICLTARQLNGTAAVVTRCRELKNAAKMAAAGAEKVVSPSHIGGLRMVSEMVRPTVVSFLDIMLRDQDKNLRVEELAVGSGYPTIAALQLQKYPNTLLLAVQTPTGWIYNPPGAQPLAPGHRLVVMTTPWERDVLSQHLQAGSPPPPKV
jgi:voltage-gated potassium channel